MPTTSYANLDCAFVKNTLVFIGWIGPPWPPSGPLPWMIVWLAKKIVPLFCWDCVCLWRLPSRIPGIFLHDLHDFTGGSNNEHHHFWFKMMGSMNCHWVHFLPSHGVVCHQTDTSTGLFPSNSLSNNFLKTSWFHFFFVIKEFLSCQIWK